VKVLVLSWEFPPLIDGGLGRHVAELVPALCRQGVNIHVLTPYPEPKQSAEEIGPGYVIHRVNIAAIDRSKDIYVQAQQANKLLYEAAGQLWAEAGGFDLIHVHDWLVSFAALRLKETYRCPLVATMHATERGRWRGHIPDDSLPQAIIAAENRLTFEAWRVIACSRHMLDELRHYFDLPADKIDMIPNGINTATLPQFSPEALAHFRQQYVIPQAPLIFSVGRMVYEKGQHVLLGAMPTILTVFPQAKLVLAGKGPLLGFLQSIVGDMGIQEHVHFVGFVDDLERDKFFASASCAVFPSLYEPFGIVALEAMAFNCPVVVSNLNGLAEVVEHLKTGVFVYPDNSESAAWGVLQVLQKPLFAQQLAENARQVIEEKYSWSYIAQQTALVYRRVVAERADTDW